MCHVVGKKSNPVTTVWSIFTLSTSHISYWAMAERHALRDKGPNGQEIKRKTRIELKNYEPSNLSAPFRLNLVSLEYKYSRS